MTSRDFIALLPLLITAYTGVVLMLVVAFRRSHATAFVLTLTGLAAAFASIFAAYPHAPRAVTPLIRIDAYSLYFTGLILAGAILVTLLSRDYLQTRAKRSEAFYILLLFAVAGMEAIAYSSHFVSFFLGLETLSVSLYGLIAYTKDTRPPLEGAIKYLVLAAVASAFLLFGIALVYAEFGTMEFHRLAALVADKGLTTVSLLGLALILVGIGFKLAVAPFHMWSPDVYQGAPAPVTALIATGSKGAVFALLLRLVAGMQLEADRTVFITISVLAIATMFAGNLLALLQNNVKRMLAYSSIAHVGYLLIPLLATDSERIPSVLFYFASYFATVIAAFGVISVLSRTRSTGDAEAMSDYRGLGATHPVLAAVLSLALISLTGLPLSAGFIAKFYIFSAAARSGLWTLLIIGVLNSGISAYYYLRPVIAMWSRPETAPEDLPGARPLSAIALAIAGAVIFALGVYPGPLVRLVQHVVTQAR